MTPSVPNNSVAVIADDEDLGRLLLSEAAAEAGLSPLAFDNGLDALAAALKPGVGIVLLDVDMPGMDGFAVCRNLRNEPRLRSVPIIIVTGHEDRGAINKAFEAGATDFITKPVNWALLPHRLEYVLRNAASSQALADREAKVHALLEAVPDALWVASADGDIRWNPRTAGAVNQQGGTANQPIAPAEYMPEVLAAIRQTAARGSAPRLEYRIAEGSGARRSFELRFSRYDNDGVLVVRQDTTERRLAAEHIERLAYFDALTGLPNRQQALEVAGRLLSATSDEMGLAVIYLDLNSFKRINDTFGHSVGDFVLKTVADRLSTALQPHRLESSAITLARFGGDEFVVLVGQLTSRDFALRVADSCQAALRDPIHFDRLEFFSTPSVGIALYPDDGRDVETLLKNADTAMYHAKANAASGVAIYTPAMTSRVRDWLDLEARLRRAVREERLYLQYQPKFRVRDNTLGGVEALIRWRDGEHGDISPTRFIAMAEESGLIIDIGAWVTRTACRQIREWLDKGFEVPIAINVSGKELLHGDPASVIEAQIAAAGIPARLLEVEITESVLVKDSAGVRASLDRIRALGCRIALDDFGTGYSSLAYITRFPPDRIKIDRSFVHNVDHSASDAAIANAILSLAQSLNLEVTAEGVERSGQLEWLRARGCHQVQGFLLSRPLSAAAIAERFLEPKFLSDSAILQIR